jgi:cyanophycin synthetase
MHPPIISVTGTKGKSTVTYVLADVLGRYGETTLRVDTTGYYVNGEQKGSLASSKRVSRLVPTVCPGRFLTAMEDVEEFTAVLECSLGCSNLAGLGYKVHNVGIFTNVFEDHIGSTERLKTKADIAEAKRFIFSRIHPVEGTAVFNADDEYVTGELPYVPEGAQFIPCGLTFKHFDLPAHLGKGGVAVTVANGKVVLRSQQGDHPLLAVNDVIWTFNGAFTPSVYNLLFIVGALVGHFKGEVPAKVWELLKQSRLDPHGGRLTLLRSDQGVTILADYAHEKNSLMAVGDLAKALAKRGKVIGVVRLAYDRTDELIEDTAKAIAPHFDQFIVYDKVDGHWRKPKPTIGSFKMVVGRISEVFASALKQQKADVTRIIREDEAIARAAKVAKPEDVVVVIVNDDIHRSLQFIKDSFKADFI